MRKRVVLAVLMVLVLLASSGCSLIVKDEAVDLATTVIEVAGKTFTKAQVLNQIEYQHNVNYNYYSQYGLAYDPTSQSAIRTAREAAINALIQSAVCEQKVTEKGLDTFTAEEEEEIRTSCQEQYDFLAEIVKSSQFADTELTGEELDAAVGDVIVQFGYGTVDQMIEMEKANRMQQRLFDDTVKDVAVSEEELTSTYEGRVEADKTKFVDNATIYDYGTTVTNGTTAYYAPAGYRRVKQILVRFTSDDQSKLDEAQKNLTAKQSELSSAQSALEALEEGDESAAELSANVEALTAEVNALQADVDAAREAAYAAIQPTVEEIQAKLAEGESFESLIDAYNQDPGMTSTSEGYLVSENSRNWVAEFTEGSMALSAIGDVSEPVRTSYGFHIIQYASDVAEGEIGLENVRDELTAELLNEKQQDAYRDAVDAWVKDANAKVNEKAL